jgi:hypothetical protein
MEKVPIMNIKRRISKECHGCFSNNISSFSNNISACNKMYYYKNGKCPCGICLIKGICNNSCREYDEFWTGMDVIEYYKNNPPKPKGEPI